MTTHQQLDQHMVALDISISRLHSGKDVFAAEVQAVRTRMAAYGVTPLAQTDIDSLAATVEQIRLRVAAAAHAQRVS